MIQKRADSIPIECKSPAKHGQVWDAADLLHPVPHNAQPLLPVHPNNPHAAENDPQALASGADPDACHRRRANQGAAQGQQLTLGRLHPLPCGIPIHSKVGDHARDGLLPWQQSLNIISILCGHQPACGHINANATLTQVAQQGLPCKQIHEGCQRAALPDPSTAMVEGALKPIDNRTSVGVSQQYLHPRNKPRTNTQGLPRCKQKIPGHSVIRLPEIQEGGYCRLVASPQQLRQQLQKPDTVPDMPVLQKGTLCRINNVPSHPQQPVGQQLGHKPIVIIEQLDGPVSIHICSHTPGLQHRHHCPIQEP
jgi:hypothetical protein